MCTSDVRPKCTRVTARLLRLAYPSGHYERVVTGRDDARQEKENRGHSSIVAAPAGREQRPGRGAGNGHAPADGEALSDLGTRARPAGRAAAFLAGIAEAGRADPDRA